MLILFKFKKIQEIFEIGGIKIGGQPGELPTVLIGSIFHVGHKIVKDRKLGVFDKKKAERLIKVQEEISEKTGIPCMLDVVGENPDALFKYVDFVSEITNTPFLLNGPNKSVRIAAIKYAIDIGLKDKAIYNSINYTLGEEEIMEISENGVKSALIQGFNPKNPQPKGTISILKALLKRASEAGIDTPLIFTPVMDVPSIGYGAKAVNMAKEEFGIPTGTAPVGVVGPWAKVKGLESNAKMVCRGSAATITQSTGVDFIIYGTIARAKYIFPVCAMIDAIIAYNANNYGIRPLIKKHPLYKIFNNEPF